MYFSYKIPSNRSLAWPEQIKSAELFHTLYMIFIKNNQWLTLNNFKKKTHLLSLVVHHVPLHGGECASQVDRHGGSLYFWKVVDDSHPDPLLCIFWSGNTKLKTVKWHTPSWKILELKTWFRNALRYAVALKKTKQLMLSTPVFSSIGVIYPWHEYTSGRLPLTHLDNH